MDPDLHRDGPREGIRDAERLVMFDIALGKAF